MNTPVSSKIKQLLYDKGFRYEVGRDEITCSRVKQSLAEQRWNEGDLSYVDITIAEVVMWLYEKHGIWIRVTPIPYSDNLTHWRWEHMSTNYFTRNLKWKKEQDYMSPTEAHEAAIEYTLKNLL